MWIDKGEGLEMKSHYTISKEDFCEEYEMPMAIGPVEKKVLLAVIKHTEEKGKRLMYRVTGPEGHVVTTPDLGEAIRNYNSI